MEKIFYRCKVCGNLVGLVEDGGAPMMCCGEKMQRLEPNSVDASHEKHVPVVSRDGEKLSVMIGGAEHPMTGEHYIVWIMVTQGNKTQRVSLTPQDKPKADFTVNPDGELSVFAYCNLHGLWKKEVK
ncbi:MAG: desulfoferrodoxin [Oscillospiraceae bacterium]|jgi:superoxide reductase|nr:desulfoferrodoxin [Oscillospiraceae bacterium]